MYQLLKARKGREKSLLQMQEIKHQVKKESMEKQIKMEKAGHIKQIIGLLILVLLIALA